MALTRAYEEVVDLIAGGTTPEGIAEFQPSPETRERAWTLLELQREGNLTVEDQSELEHYLQLEHIMRLAKARARRHLASR